jgi:hypothetical protein
MSDIPPSVYVCIYVCIYVCMYVCMYVCVKQLQVNSLGDTWSRNRYRDALIKYFTARRPFLSSLSQHRYGMVRFLSHPSFCFSTSVYLCIVYLKVVRQWSISYP